jgi:hypothetical protein
MRHLTFAVGALCIAALALSASAQESTTPAKTGTSQAAASQASPGQKAMQKAAEGGKFLFVLFWRDQTTQTDKTWESLKNAADKCADNADVVPIRTTDPAEKAIVDKFNVSKSPMPLILAVAPCGAVTKAFPGNFDERQLASAFVSPCEQLVMKNIQSSKLVFVNVVYEVPADGEAAVPQGVKDFKADAKYDKATEIVTLNATDKKEADFLKELSIDVKAKKPISVLLAPGALIGTFGANVTKQQIVTKISSAQSGCCPGGKCGPGGCGPQK